jgi:hypothetical protein
MSPILRAAFFEIVGVLSFFSIVKDLTAGNTTNRRMTIDARENPGGFYLVMLCKAGFVCFAVAVILNALGLIGDPFVWVQQTFPFLVRK